MLKSKRRKASDNIARIYKYLTQVGEAKTNAIATYIGLSALRTRAMLQAISEETEIINESLLFTKICGCNKIKLSMIIL